MERRWTYLAEREPPQAFTDAIGGHPLVAQGLFNRGIDTAEQALPFLDADRYRPTPPVDLPAIQVAVERTELALERQEQICVWGDFDVDGQTATAILTSTLRELGAQATFYVPHRASESHGLNVEGVKRLAARDASLLVTCDTGIRDHEAVEIANELGVDVIITDHHDPPETLPAALTCINPKLLPDEHPLKELPGVGAAFLLAWALLAEAGRPGIPQNMLDLVALGIVADLARLRADTRYYLQLGLVELQRSQRLGLQSLMQTADLAQDQITESDIGFAIAPRLNSLGRLGDANLGVEFLMTEDAEFARSMADELEGLNAKRRLLADQVFQAAVSRIDREGDAPAIILDHQEWPDGVIGLVAGRLADRFGKPAVLIAVGRDGIGRGSARSVPGVDITAAFEANQALLERFGGHPMAGGFALPADRIPEFRSALYRTLRDARPVVPSLRIDGVIGLSELTMDFVRELERLAPFGPGNPSFVLATRDLSVRAVRAFGRNSDHLRVRIVDRHGADAEVIWWQGAREPLPDGAFDLALRPSTHFYRGESGVQLEWIEARRSEQPQIELGAPALPELVDLRGSSDPLAAVQKLDHVQIWSEVIEADELEVHNRRDLTPSSALVIWSTPPGPLELRAAIRKVRPSTIFLFRGSTVDLSAIEFTERLIGLAKFAIQQRNGNFDVGLAAAALGHRELAIETGLIWLDQAGVIAVEIAEGHIWRVAAREGIGVNLEAPPEALRELLRETAAFREYWREASIEALKRLIV